MAREHTGTNIERSEYYGALQDVVDSLFSEYGDLDPLIAEAIGAKVRRLDVVLAAEAADLPEELLRIVTLLPPGEYTRERLCTQLNSALAGHAWGQVYGTVV
ncbi:hypothetical protein PZH32_08870 [Adlercreutzia equolifaciens]|uniref:hypothetical protein n=1 Tax=Adlercreutzia equolifaciens TaxID=446660 RepID=UPI0023AFAFF7|nr:hypothetical protein [Adlercreutzia equolifaciens]MDE8703070.1 hypothetical protein [Adlercreutzia equolifaciens]